MRMRMFCSIRADALSPKEGFVINDAHERDSVSSAGSFGVSGSVICSQEMRCDRSIEAEGRPKRY